MTETWATKLCKKAHRDISPRALVFIERLRDTCRSASKKRLSKAARRKLTDSIKIDVDMFASHWDSVHGIGGLCEILCECMNAVMEMRMEIEYGDYLAESLKQLKKDNFDEKTRGKQLHWREHGNWQDISAILHSEEQANKSLDDSIRRGPHDHPLPHTPCLNDIHVAANKLGIDYKQIIFEIHSYAARKEICHSGVSGMIERCEWPKLANRICYDKQWLSKIFEGRPVELMRMRVTIANLEKVWFSECWMDPNGTAVFQLTDAALKASKRMTSRMLSKKPDNDE